MTYEILDFVFVVVESRIVILAEMKELFRMFYKAIDPNSKALFFFKSTVTYRKFGNSCFVQKIYFILVKFI